MVLQRGDPLLHLQPRARVDLADHAGNSAISFVQIEPSDQGKRGIPRNRRQVGGGQRRAAGQREYTRWSAVDPQQRLARRAGGAEAGDTFERRQIAQPQRVENLRRKAARPRRFLKDGQEFLDVEELNHREPLDRQPGVQGGEPFRRGRVLAGNDTVGRTFADAENEVFAVEAPFDERGAGRRFRAAIFPPRRFAPGGASAASRSTEAFASSTRSPRSTISPALISGPGCFILNSEMNTAIGRLKAI